MIDRREVNAPHGEARAQARKELADPVVPEAVRREKAVMKGLIRDVAEVHGHPVMTVIQARIRDVEKVSVRIVNAIVGMQVGKAGVPVHVVRQDRRVHPAEMIREGQPEAMIEEVLLEEMIGEVPPGEMIGEVPPEEMIGEVPPERMIGGVPPEAMIGGVQPEKMIGEGPLEDRAGTTAEGLPPLEGHQSLGKHRAAMSAPSVKAIR